MSLVADYSSDDSSDDKKQLEFLLKKPEIVQLPSANSLLIGKPGEVFNNVYKKAEEMKLASLEKHCKMVDNEDHIKEKNGKKICWNYRKGRCRFGSNCTFAHDSDLHNNTTLNSKESNAQKQDIPKVTLTTSRHKTEQYKNNSNSECVDNSTETVASTGKKRKRPGLGDSIIPSKKVLKAYSTSKQQNKRNC